MIRVREAIVVEGKYDKIRLESVVDGLIIETNGFRIFKDKEQRDFLRRLAAERGLLVLTDSDAAGFVIRSHLAGFIPPDEIKHAFVPEIRGKERRKAAPSKEGLLGVEGMDGETLRTALLRAGATVLDGAPGEESGRPGSPAGAPLSRLDLYEAGLIGAPDSASKRERLLVRLGLPRRLSTGRLLTVLQGSLSREDFRKLAEEMTATEAAEGSSGSKEGG